MHSYRNQGGIKKDKKEAPKFCRSVHCAAVEIDMFVPLNLLYKGGFCKDGVFWQYYSSVPSIESREWEALKEGGSLNSLLP